MSILIDTPNTNFSQLLASVPQSMPETGLIEADETILGETFLQILTELNIQKSQPSLENFKIGEPLTATKNNEEQQVLDAEVDQKPEQPQAENQTNATNQGKLTQVSEAPEITEVELFTRPQVLTRNASQIALEKLPKPLKTSSVSVQNAKNSRSNHDADRKELFKVSGIDQDTAKTLEVPSFRVAIQEVNLQNSTEAPKEVPILKSLLNATSVVETQTISAPDRSLILDKNTTFQVSIPEPIQAKLTGVKADETLEVKRLMTVDGTVADARFSFTESVIKKQQQQVNFVHEYGSKLRNFDQLKEGMDDSKFILNQEFGSHGYPTNELASKTSKISSFEVIPTSPKEAASPKNLNLFEAINTKQSEVEVVKHVSLVAPKPEDNSIASHTQRDTPQQQIRLSANNISEISEAVIKVQTNGRNIGVSLTPEDLGRLNVKLDQTASGSLVTFSAERGETQDLVRRHIDAIQSHMKSMGFENLSFSFSREQQKNHRETTQITLSDETVFLVETEVIAKPSKATSTNLDIRI